MIPVSIVCAPDAPPLVPLHISDYMASTIRSLLLLLLLIKIVL